MTPVAPCANCSIRRVAGGVTRRCQCRSASRFWQRRCPVSAPGILQMSAQARSCRSHATPTSRDELSQGKSLKNCFCVRRIQLAPQRQLRRPLASATPELVVAKELCDQRCLQRSSARAARPAPDLTADIDCGANWIPLFCVQHWIGVRGIHLAPVRLELLDGYPA